MPQSAAFVQRFYRRLILTSPELQGLFRTTDFGVQHAAFMLALVHIVDHLNDSAVLSRVVERLSVRHAAAHVKAEYCPLVGAALLNTLATFLGARWTWQLAAAWQEAYQMLSDALLAQPAHDRSAESKPADLSSAQDSACSLRGSASLMSHQQP